VLNSVVFELVSIITFYFVAVIVEKYTAKPQLLTNCLPYRIAPEGIYWNLQIVFVLWIVTVNTKYTGLVPPSIQQLW
jgi:hypothetical protein